jgi:hypothetical protein
VETPAADNEAWLVDQVGQQRPVDGRTRTDGDRLVVTAQALRDLALAAGRPFGLQVSGLRVLGHLDLSYAEVKGPIVITESEFTGEIDCNNAVCVNLDLTGSSFPSLVCSAARIQHNLVLSSVNAELVVLYDAEIAGSLILIGGTLTGRGGVALGADRVRVVGGVFCSDGFSAKGTVRLAGASIGGQLNLSGSTVSNPGGVAVFADQAQIAGGVFCEEHFSAAGLIRLDGADIGLLSLNGATLSNPDDVAFSADQARIGSVFCGKGFSATGEIRLLDVDIGGPLVLTGGTFSNPGGDAISVDRALVAAGVFCREGFTATGAVRLPGAQIGGNLELSGGAFSNPEGFALYADRMQVSGSVFCRSGFVATGKVELNGATIVDLLDLAGGSFSNPSGYAVSAERATIGTLAFTKSGMNSGGKISLLGAHAGYLEDRPDAWQPYGSLQLLDLTYDRINHADWTVAQRLEWLKKAAAHQNQPYEQLAATLRAQGHEREARRILIAKHTQQRRAQPWYTRFPGLLFGGLLAHGYRPLQRTVPLLLALYLLGAFLLLPQARAHHAVIATRVPVHAVTTAPSVAAGQASQPIVAAAHCPSDYPCFSPWAYTLDVLVPLVNTHQTDYWTVISKHGDRGAIWYIRLAPALGWILSTAAALGFTGLIRRDS